MTYTLVVSKHSSSAQDPRASSRQRLVPISHFVHVHASMVPESLSERPGLAVLFCRTRAKTARAVGEDGDA